MRLGVTGGRKYDDASFVAATLAAYPADAVLVYGDAPGADRLCARVWRALGRIVEPHRAKWAAPCRDTCTPGHRVKRGDGTDYCPAAGVYRNQEMVDSGLDLLIAFPGGVGTADMIYRTGQAGVDVVDLREGSVDVEAISDDVWLAAVKGGPDDPKVPPDRD